MKISNVSKISPGLHRVPVDVRYQGISSYINLLVFSHQSGMAWAGPWKL